MAVLESISYKKLESIPISDNEAYKFDYDPKHGVIFEFSKVDDEEEMLN